MKTKLREWDLNPRLPAYEAGEIPLLHPAALFLKTKLYFSLRGLHLTSN